MTAPGTIVQSSLPSITVIVPVYNEETHISQTLRQLAEQDYPADLLDVVIADGGSTDRTREHIRDAARSLPFKLTLLDNPRRLSGAARNLAVTSSRSEYVLIVDGHVFIPSRALIRDMATAIRESGASVLGRPQPQTPPDIDAFQAMVAAVRASPLAHSTESYIYSEEAAWVSPISVGVMYRRSLFEQFGLFDEELDAVEDLEFNYRLERAGLSAYISPKFAVFYYPRESLRQLFRQMYRYGLGRINFSRKHPERLRVEVFAPLLASAGFLIGVAAYLTLPGLRPVLSLAAIVLSASIITITACHIRNRKFRQVWLAPLCLLTIYLGLGYGVLCALLGRRSGSAARSSPGLAVASHD